MGDDYFPVVVLSWLSLNGYEMLSLTCSAASSGMIGEFYANIGFFYERRFLYD